MRNFKGLYMRVFEIDADKRKRDKGEEQISLNVMTKINVMKKFGQETNTPNFEEHLGVWPP